MDDLKEAALAYAARGWPVFPCRADKTPYTAHGVLDASTNKRAIADWWDEYPNANIGLDVAGAGMLVLDLDPGHDPKRLAEVINGTPATTLRSRTPRGGEHWFYEIDRDEMVSPSASKIAPHVDVRSFHSYVILPPGRTKDGAYQWEAEGRPVYRPDRVVELTNQGRERDEKHDTWLVEPDLPENVESATKWLREDAKIAIEGQNGDTMAYATAAHLKSFGISPELALDLMWEHWSPRCQPPWSSDQLWHLQEKVENGYHYNTSPPGNITRAYKVARKAQLFKPRERDLAAGRQVEAGRFRIVDRDGLDQSPPMAWLVDGFIPEDSYGILYGTHGAYKSFVALDVSLTVATGASFPWAGMWEGVTDQGAVLYCAGEGRSGIRKRVTAWEQRYGLRGTEFLLCDPVPAVTEDLDPFLEAALSMRDGYKLVVIDTLGRALQGVDENKQEYASAFTAQVEEIKRSLGNPAVLVLHHTGHDHARARGSSVFGADADFLVGAEAVEPGLCRLTMAKQKDAEPWQQPRLVRMETVKVGPGETSLAASPAKREDDKREQRRTEHAAASHVVVTVVTEVLNGNPMREWTMAALADRVANDERIELGSQALRKKHFGWLSQSNDSPVRALWNADKRRWRGVV